MTELLKPPTKKEVEKLIVENEFAYQKYLPIFKENCIRHINDKLSKHNWGTYNQLGTITIVIPFELHNPYKTVDPLYKLIFVVYGELVKELNEAGWHVFSTTGEQFAMSFTLHLKNY